MKNTWKPRESLLTDLADAGIDTDILQDMLSQINELNLQSNELVPARIFIAKAIAKQAIRNTSFDHFESHSAHRAFAGSRLDKEWKPKEPTMRILLIELECDRVEIGYKREEFKEKNLGKLKSEWDILFMEFIMDYPATSQEGALEETVKQESNGIVEPDISDTQKYINMFRVDKLVSQALREINIGPYFRKKLDADWRPSEWAVKKLIGLDINKRFIFDDGIRHSFIENQKENGKLMDNLDEKYCDWVKIEHKKYTDLKQIIERMKAELEK